MNESTLVPREEMNDLDWLARNVHEWTEGKREVLVCWPRNVDTIIWSSVLSDAGWITKDQWLARRAELQNKPSWKDVPEWAEWIAQSPNGHWEFFSAKPIAYKWWRHPLDVKSKANDASKTGLILGDWRDTLEKRPEDNLKSMSGVHSAGDMATLLDELNDIDESVFGDGFLHKNAATTKQPTPKGSGNPILGMVLADLTNRALEGKEKYGEPLLAHNGRNPLWDAYQEALDLAMYLRQAIEEHGK